MGKDRLLRRQDHTLDIAGGCNVANFFTDTTEFQGIKLPTKRRAYMCDEAYNILPKHLLIWIDFSNFLFIYPRFGEMTRDRTDPLHFCPALNLFLRRRPLEGQAEQEGGGGYRWPSKSLNFDLAETVWGKCGLANPDRVRSVK